MLGAALFALLPTLAVAQVAQSFVKPAPCPTCQSNNYVGKSNGSLPVAPVVPGAVYDRFITIWLENTDFSAAAASPTFQKIASQGILLTDYNGVTHPSEPNYVASMTGDFFGCGDDDFYYLPSNVSSMVDLLETKNISWASYQENMPTAGWAADFSQTNYLNTSATAKYAYYKRKHNPHIITNSVAAFPERALRVRNFNDFAVDVNASSLPQHVFVTPNMVNDAHDTDVTFVSDWLEYWFMPLLSNPNFNSNRTLIQLTFDESGLYTHQNTIFTVLLGGAVPSSLHGTNDTRFYTHYSMLSSVQNNWGLQSLGRQDTNKTMAAVFQFQANATGYENYDPQPEEIPMLNLTGIFPGAMNTEFWTPIPAPDVNAVGAGNGSVFYNVSATNLASTMDTMAAVNLTAFNLTNPIMVNPNYTYTGFSVVNKTSSAAIAASNTSSTPSQSNPAAAVQPTSAAGKVHVALGGVVAAAALGLSMLL